MDDTRLDLGIVDSLRAESFGEPGQRTFRILAQVGAGSVSLWLEKQQLMMLGTAVEEVLRRVPAPAGENPRASGQTPYAGDLELHIGTLAVGYDALHSAFTLEASEFVTPLGISSVAISTGRAEFDLLADEIERIVAAGRPRCPLCGTPLTGSPHFCPPSNGHARVTTSD